MSPPSPTPAAAVPGSAEKLATRIRERDDLLAGLIHDLRNPLNVILTWTHLLQEGVLDGETTTRAVDTICRNAELQARMLSTFVDYARLVDERAEMEFVPSELPPIVGGATGAVRSRAAAKPIRLDVDVEPPPRRVSSDAEWLSRALRGLLEHAIDATPPAGRVALTLRSTDGTARLEIRRTGAPFSAAEVARIFDPVGPSDPARGRGNLHLELAIASRVARQHGGEVTVTNASDGDGVVYGVNLPLIS